MAHREEPMDVDCMDGDFDKENSYHLSNVLPCTEKGYEELDVSELNMKLRYSITPAASPMSKSYTACIGHRNLDSDDSLNCVNENANLTRSLNSAMTKNDSVIKSLKAMPLQSISTEHVVDNRGSVLRQFDSTSNNDNNVTITISETNDINENLSLPSSSSSALHTPEATTPTNITKNEEGSPIMRGLKSVFNMFRSSQSPIPHVDNDESVKQKVKDLDPDETYCEDQQSTIASTPISAHRSRDGSSKRSSPLKDSIIFNDDLEKELLWKDETILFSEEKIPIHKLFLQQNKPAPLAVIERPQKDHEHTVDNRDSTMDVSLNNSIMLDQTLTETHNNTNTIESDGEFLDCETTFTKNESANAEGIEKTLEILTNEIENKIIPKAEKSEDKEEDKPQIVDITRDIVTENYSTLNEIIENQDVPSGDADRKLDFNSSLMHAIEINENILIYNTEATPVEEIVIAEPNISPQSKSIEISTDISSEPKTDDVEHRLIEARHNVEEDISLQENVTKSVVLDNLNVSNEITSADVTFEVDTKTAEPEKIQVMENEKNCKDFENMLNEPTKNVDLDTNLNSVKQNACFDNTADTVTNVCLTSVPEHNNQIAQPPNGFNFESEDLQFSPCNLLVEEPANTPLPDNDDFDADLSQNKHEIEKIQTIPPDVLDSVITDIKLDATETLSNVLDDSNITENVVEPNILPVSDKQDVLNETKDIVNSLTEMIGESQNHTIIQSECMLDQSQNYEMEGIECTEEIHLLPDLVNETIHNMSVDIDSEIVPALMKRSQPEEGITTFAIDDTLGFSTAPENKSDATEQNKLIFENICTSEAKITTEVNNEFINANKEHINAIVEPYENIESAPKMDSINNVCDELKENKHLDANFVLNTEVNEVPVVDEELVLSGNNSPYVSVISEKEPNPTEEILENIDFPLTTTTVAPSSPPIRSKGYNFNFDEMDDPFATKTKIRQSPSPSKVIEPNDENKTKTGASKKVAPSRRKSQPPERKRAAFNKKKFNTTFDATVIDNSINKSNDQNSDGDSKNVTLKNTSITTDINNVVDKEVVSILDSTQVLENVQSEENFIRGEDVACEINAENKLSTESISATTSAIKTYNSSSEQSTYYSAAASSSDSSISKNVFNIPEIDDKNFNPFATKSKMRQSPPLDFERENQIATNNKMNSSPDLSIFPKENTSQSIENIIKKEVEDKMDTELMEKDSSYNVSNITPSSNTTDEKHITIREVNTDDEDTEEGPFLEAEDAIDKLLGIENDDMMQFNEIPPQSTEENVDGGELFIDAEAFEFLLNKNQSNVVTDSGKESLFLKFDPLFAKRISNDGVLAALNKVHKKQSTPTKPTRPSLRNEASPIAGPSTLNATYDEESNVTQDSIEDLNVTVAKPMMVVTPAVNPAVTPRNKTTTPPRSNRRSITFTSPAMAVIDRLLSLSANNSLLGHDTTVTQTNREHIEADIALSQLRELLAEKEISVYQLKSESKELKDRLSTMETQVKILEADGHERLNKINELNDRLAEKTNINKSMAAVVEEYERTIASLIAETEQDKKRHAEERVRLINERDEQTAHLASMEVSFSDLHSKYEKSKQIILSCKANEETCKKSIKDFEANLTKMQANYEMLKQHATSKLNHANQELQKMNKAHESEVLKLNAMIKRKEMHITSLEETLAQKTKANEELTAICDELINKVG